VTPRNRKLLALAAVPAILAIPGHASANDPIASATCEAGLTFNMSSGVADTKISATLDGRTVRTATVAAQFDSTSFAVPSPDRTVSHVWTVFVDAPWDIEDQSFRISVPACVAAATTTSSTTTTTTVAPTTTTPVVANDIPPVPSTTTIAPPRATVPPSTAPAFVLPETGADDLWLAVSALALVVFGALLVLTSRPN
jgi:LPXTG-motif cell wall-anchored protein